MLIAHEITPSIVQSYFLPSLPKFTFFNEIPLHPETETAFFVVFVALSSCLFSGFLGLASLLKNSKGQTTRTSIEASLLAGLCLGISVIGKLPYASNLTHSLSFYIVVMVVAVVWWSLSLRWPRAFHDALQVLLLAALGKYLAPAFLEFDVGYYGDRVGLFPAVQLHSKILWPHYLHLLWAIPLAILCRKRMCRFLINSDRNWLWTIGAFVTLSVILAITILPATQFSQLPTDMFFTVLPAYHIVHGGVPFNDVMSQYGMLYLAPWILAILLFPTGPFTVEFMSMVTMVLVIMYGMGLFIVLRRLQGNSALAVIGVIACLFYSTFNRVYFYPDKLNIYSGPAFTPVRFGCFLLPLFFLTRYIKAPTDRALSWYVYSCIALLYFSSDLGVGIAIAGLATLTVSVLLKSPSDPLGFRIIAFKTIEAFVVSLCLVSGITLAFRGALPDFTMYTTFITLFSSGFYMEPIHEQMAIVVPFSLALIAVCIGVSLLRKGDRAGLAMMFLAFCQLVALPYYLGRSYPPLLYSTCMPSILIASLLLSQLARQESENGILRFAGVTFSSLILFCATLRTTLATAEQWTQKDFGLSRISTSLRAAARSSPVKETPQYRFLSQTVPIGSPIALFDQHEELLLTSLQLKPAFPYSFICNFLVSKEQLDWTIARIRGREFFVFVNNSDVQSGNGQSPGLYQYFWKIVEPHAKLLREEGVFKLYTVWLPT